MRAEKYNKLIRVITILVFIFTGSGFLFAILARIDEVINAPGDLQVIGGNLQVKSPLEGSLKAIFVKEGDSVKKGDVLVKIDDSINNLELIKLNEEIVNLKENYLMQKKLVKKIDPLRDEGAVSEIYLIREKKDLLNLSSDIKSKQSRINKLNILISQSLIKSPANGKVFDLKVAGVGYVTSRGEALLKIIPEKDLEAKVLILNKDIGFIRENMEVRIRIDSLPYSQFGYLKGKVKSIGDEVVNSSEISNQVQSKYPIYLSLENQYLEKEGVQYKIRAGQTVTASFKVRDKPVLSLFSDIFEKTFDSLKNIISKKSYKIKKDT